MTAAERRELAGYTAAADLREALRRFERRTELVARRHGLTPQRYALLLMIKGAPDGSERSRITDLAERLQLRQSSVTELVDRAEDAGLVTRRPDRIDGRVVWLALTRTAERRLAATVAEMGRERERLEALLRGLG